ncbi:carboxypeptidase Q isoform X2 [Dendrobates tinctorius]|uniref:carboxypeptidase Q isoform X2 n=1 Tax=Dendrobates tinctorius TaxID=92724 RepID=UPI003CC9577B
MDEGCKSLSGSQKLTPLLCTHIDYKQTGHRGSFIGSSRMKPSVLASGLMLYILYICVEIGNQQKVSPRKLKQIKKEVANYKDIAKSIIDLAIYGSAQNRSYERLALFVDTIGNRVSGSDNLKNAIKYMYNALHEDQLQNVSLEPVKIPHWERGKELAIMIQPREKNLAILGLGGSVGTPVEGITAEVLVVSSFDELQRRSVEAKGKIVVYNQPFISYGETVQYRSRGASEAAKVGAVASLIRSIAPFSINSPHTGWQDYESGVQKIPTACITIEDAELMARLAARGVKIVVNLNMGAVQHPDADSFNTVAEIVGSKYPEQVVIVSGHLDSWDVGQGAMDDGGGAFISWEALSLVKDLGLRPKRTIRLVLWTGEEQGGVGSSQYYDMHKKDIANMDLVMETDMGTFMPLGMEFSGKPEARAIMSEIMQLLEPINITKLYDHADGTDISFWMEAGVPGASLLDDISKYFWFHHSEGDTMTVQNPVWMNLCAAIWTVVAYVVADLEEMLPR